MAAAPCSGGLPAGEPALLLPNPLDFLGPELPPHITQGIAVRAALQHIPPDLCHPGRLGSVFVVRFFRV